MPDYNDKEKQMKDIDEMVKLVTMKYTKNPFEIKMKAFCRQVAENNFD